MDLTGKSPGVELRRRAHWLLWLGCVVGALVMLAACGSSNASSSQAAPTTGVSEDQASDVPTPDYQPDVQYDVTGAGGNTASVELSYGQTSLASDSTSTAVQACADSGVVMDRAVVIPYSFSLKITSTTSAAVSVQFMSSGMVQAGSVTPLAGTLLASSYSDGDTCDAHGVQWSSVEPGAVEVGHFYEVIPDAITPDAPSAEDVAQQFVLDTPNVTFNDTNTALTQPVSGTNLADCHAGDPAAPARPFGAYDVDAVIAGGCDAWTDSDSPTASESPTVQTSSPATNVSHNFAGTWTGKMTSDEWNYPAHTHLVLTGPSGDLSGTLIFNADCGSYKIKSGQADGATLTVTGRATDIQDCGNPHLTFTMTGQNTMHLHFPGAGDPSVSFDADLTRQ
ncbi:MAG: hypothetical protein WB797_02240 [Nocardioides sp.]